MSDTQYHQALSANRKLVAEIDQLKAENERFKKVLKCVEQAWYNQRPSDIIRLVDEALAWKEPK